ncbi:MAG: hypothetical protein IJH34_09135, partial [Romboutsia sp.]|nr:hypothetical protein [Romboutsia sp.]
MLEAINSSPQGYYIWLGLLGFCLISIFTIVIFDGEKKEDDENLSKSKKFRGFSRQKLARERINSMIEMNMDYKKKTSIEKLIWQAGYDFSPVDYYIMCFGASILLGLLLQIVLTNIFVTVIVAIIGYMSPKLFLSSRKTKRTEKHNAQVGTLLSVVIGIYEKLNDFSESLRLS